MQGVCKGVSTMIGHGIDLRSGEKSTKGVREREKLLRSVGLKGSWRESSGGASGCARRWWPEVPELRLYWGCRCDNDKG